MMDKFLADRLDDAVGWWHDVDGLDDIPLHQYLGMDWDEYGHWVHTGQLPPAIDALDVGSVQYWPLAGHCWVCGERAHYIDLDFQAAVCGGICIWAGWEALRLHDTPWRAWC